MQLKPFRAEYPLADRIGSPDTFCERAKNAYADYRRTRLVKEWPNEALYIYRIRGWHRSHIGLVGLGAMEDYREGRIKRHEKTLVEREQQQIELFLQWDALLKPVLLAHPPAPALSSALHEYADAHAPLLEVLFEEGKETHGIWAIDDAADIARFQQLLEDTVKTAYIADGHHRVTALAFMHDHFRERSSHMDLEHLYCAFFGADQLQISDFFRVVELSENWETTLEQLSKVFDVTPLTDTKKPVRQHEMAAYLNGSWLHLRWKQPILDYWYAKETVVLDAALLNLLVMRDLFQITDARNDSRIHYIEGKRGLEGIRRLVEQQPNSIGFALYPVSFEQMAALSDQGKTLPPKSTYFEPRLKTGLLAKRLNL